MRHRYSIPECKDYTRKDKILLIAHTVYWGAGLVMALCGIGAFI